jgi:hypothetical protein
MIEYILSFLKDSAIGFSMMLFVAGVYFLSKYLLKFLNSKFQFKFKVESTSLAVSAILWVLLIFGYDFIVPKAKVINVKGWCDFTMKSKKSDYTLDKSKIRDSVVTEWEKILNENIFSSKVIDDPLAKELSRLKMLSVKRVDSKLYLSHDLYHGDIDLLGDSITKNLGHDFQSFLPNMKDPSKILRLCTFYATDLFFSQIEIKKKERVLKIKTNSYYLVRKYDKSH